MKKIKKIISKCLIKTGQWAGTDPKLIEAVKDVEVLCRQFLFKDFPPYDEVRNSLVVRSLGTGFIEAMYIVNYLHLSMGIAGDVCEFGVAQGRTSALLAHQIRDCAKKIWLFDSFKGLPSPLKEDKLKDDIFNLNAIEKYKGTMACAARLVKRELSRIGFASERVKIVPGFIEETIHHPDLPKKACFAYVDFDFYSPILTALNFLDKVLEKSGFVVVDDYDFFSTGAKTAVDEFMASHPEKYVFSLPIEPAGKFCVIQKIA